MQANGELMEQRLKIAMLCNDFADVEQRFQLTPGVIKPGRELPPAEKS
jgi:hypothetical protein